MKVETPMKTSNNKTLRLEWVPVGEKIRTGPTVDVLYDIADERERQLARWGAQHHSDGTGPDATHPFWGAWPCTWGGLSGVVKARCDLKHRLDADTWEAILTEEFCEAMAERDVAKLREELIQVAAVCCAWVEDIDSREVR